MNGNKPYKVEYDLGVEVYVRMYICTYHVQEDISDLSIYSQSLCTFSLFVQYQLVVVVDHFNFTEEYLDLIPVQNNIVWALFYLIGLKKG